jgi:hypothetical protein
MRRNSAMRGARRWSRAKPRRRWTKPSWSPSEPMTVVLSEKGWIRAAKGHDIDAAGLSYRDGDSLLAAVRGAAPSRLRSSTAPAAAIRPRRTPALGARQRRTADRPLLAAGRRRVSSDHGQRRPNDARFVLASSHGYGFVTRSRTSPAATRPARRCSRCPTADRSCCSRRRRAHLDTIASSPSPAPATAGVSDRRPAGTRQGQGQQAHRDPESQAQHRTRDRDRGGAARRHAVR